MSDTTRNFLEIVVDPENAQLDIVAVHGLHPFGSGSNAFSTWTVTRGNEERNWLKHPDFLPSLVPTARIMIFSYNSNAVFSASSGTVNDHARNLLELLRQKRRRHPPGRPLIFICHSLGGLLVKRSLCMAYNTDLYKIIYTSTKGVVFFATPHGGGQNVSVGNIAASIFRTITNNPNNAYMEALRHNSLCSQTYKEDFLQRSNDFVFVSVMETLPTRGIMVVRKEDSVLGLQDDRERKIIVDANHTDVCKFWDPTGRAFDVVKDPICEMAEDAIASTVTAAAVPPAVNQITLVPYLENTKFHGRERQMLDIHQFFTTQSGTPRGQRRLVLQGFPGIGKTTIALQYSINYGNLYEGVFWVTALQSDTIEREYAKLDDEVKKRTSLSFRDWCSSKKWLLIIDNLDDPTCFHAQSMIPLGQGDVLITSRRTDLNQIGTVIVIPPLDDKSASDLLLLYAENRLPEDEDEVNSLKVVQMLGCVPLAIRHCGCLLSEQRSKLSSYIREFDDLMTELAIPEEFSQSSSRGAFDLNESKPLLGSFDISFTYLQRASQDAAAMLSLMANLEPTDISMEMLERSLQPHKRWDKDGNITTSLVLGMSKWLRDLPSQARGHGLREVLKTLVKYSLLFPKIEEGYYFLHPLTHFWLRWKQENAKNLEPFTDSLALLYNGFPHPEFSRTYGLTYRHQDLRNTYMPHVQHFLKRYRRLKSLVDEDEMSLLQMATLFLHASDTPQELRPMKQRIRVNVPGTNIAFPRGRLVDPFEQDVAFLEVLKDILVRLQYPGTLFLHAIYVFFEHICKEWLASHPRSAFRVQDIEFAGKSLVQVRARILEQGQESPMTESVGQESSDSEEQSDARYEVEDLKTLMPLMADPEEHSIVNTTLVKQSGIIGLIALKYIQHVRESVFEVGTRIEVDPITNAIVHIVDHRVWVPGFVAIEWIWHFKSLLFSKTERICDLTKFAHCQLALQAYQAKNDTGELHPIWPDLRLWSINATIELAGLVGPESVVGAESLFMLMWDGTNSHPPQTWVRDVDVGNALSAPISSDNYYFKIKVIDAWQYSMRARDMLKQAETLILAWLDKFLDCDRNLKNLWSFDVDPVLDLYEFAIFLFLHWAEDPEKASQFQDRYLNYFEKEYGTLLERLCLGCGVGVFGLRHARLRIRIPRPQRPQSAEGYAAEMELYLKLKGKLGAAGTSLPNNNPKASRFTEQEWCLCRQRAYMEAVGLRPPSTSLTFGNASWNALYSSETTIDDTLFQAEANKVKRLVLEAIMEGQPDLLAVLPTSTDPEHGPAGPPDVETPSVASPGEQSASWTPPLQGSSEQKVSAEFTRSNNKQRRMDRFLQRMHISRKGKERSQRD